MQIGDKVRFLNQSGEGIITAILGPTQVEVAIDGDFRIPYELRQLVPIAREERAVFGPTKIESAADRTNKLAQGTSTQPKAEHGVYLALIPKADGTLELCIANNTDYNLPFSLGLERNGVYTGLDANLLEARNIKRYGNYQRSEVNKWPVFVVQVLFHKHGQQTLKKPLLRKLEIEPESLTKPLRRLALLQVDAHIFPLDDIMLVKPEPTAIKQGIEKASQQAAIKASVAQGTQPKVQYAVQEVVDLHIEKLVANPTLYNADEMLKIQLDMFEGCISKALAAGMPKVTFIHGVGGYVLKRMITLRLKNHKQVKDYKDAPANKFGNGATEVWFG